VDKLVLVCGEITHRTVYDKDDAAKERPTPGDVQFSVKEAYPLEDAMPLLTRKITFSLDRDDPGFLEKISAIKAAADANPGLANLALQVSVGSSSVDVALGDACRAAVGVSFLSMVAKAVAQTDIAFAPEPRIYLADDRRAYDA